MVQHTRISRMWTAIRTLSLGATLLLGGFAASGQDREPPRTEREVAQQQLEIMRLALPALREGEKMEAAELLERAIRAREVMLEGGRGDRARQIRERSPDRGAQAEILGLAARLWKEFGNEDKAELVGDLARSLGARERQVRERERPERERRERPMTDREYALRQLEVMRIGLHALREAEKRDAAALLERAIRAREVILERRRDEEAAEIRERSPGRAEQAEILGLAARIWREYGQNERARAVGQLAEQLAGGDRGPREPREGDRERADRARGSRERPDRERGDREQAEPRDRGGPQAMARIERLEDHVAKLTEAIEDLQNQLREIKRRLD